MTCQIIKTMTRVVKAFELKGAPTVYTYAYTSTAVREGITTTVAFEWESRRTCVNEQCPRPHSPT